MTSRSESPVLQVRLARAHTYMRGIDTHFSGVLGSIVRDVIDGADPRCAGLTLWAIEACGGDARAALPLAACMEYLYRFCTLHDQITGYPGGETIVAQGVHARWGLAQALNAGDAFHALALGTLASQAAPPERVLAVSVMLTNSILLRVERRRMPGAGLRAAVDSTRALLSGATLRAAAMISGASDAAVEQVGRAGHFLGIGEELAKAGEPGWDLAKRYAGKAVACMERAHLSREAVEEFEEIAYSVAG